MTTQAHFPPTLAAGPSPEQWLRLNPLLDELLDLEPDARAPRLAELSATLNAQDLAMLQQWLALDARLMGAPFMERPAAQQTRLAEALTELGDLSGLQVGAYTLERELGSGGMGSVWLAKRSDGRFQGKVAVKFLKFGSFSRGARARFEREGHILARLTHPHIARLLDAGVHVLPQGGQPYLVLEYVDGMPIDTFCQARQLDVRQRVSLLLDVIDAVAHAQQRLILHRDIKPNNILVTPEGQAKLLDFGIAKLQDETQPAAAPTALTRLAGHAFTLLYAAPEQVRQQDVTTATDVYALGVLMFALLSGRHPTGDATQSDLDQLRAVLVTPPSRLSDAARRCDNRQLARQAVLMRGDLDTIAAKALKKDPAARYPNALALGADLRRWLAREPISARPDSALYTLQCFVRRHRLAVAAGSAAMLALLGLTGVSLWQAQRAATAEQHAQSRQRQSDALLAYMLGDFAERLRPIGRLELLDQVGSQALQHLSLQDHPSPTERLHRAKALTVIGEVRAGRRELDAAREPLTQAHQLLQDEPPSQGQPAHFAASWRKAQGTAAFWLGHIAYHQRRFDEAEQAWQRYRSVSQQWLHAAPQDLDAQVELAYAHNNLASLNLEQGRLLQAEALFQSALQGLTRARAARRDDPTLQAEHSNVLSWLGSTLLLLGRHPQALEVLGQALSQAQALRQAHPADRGWLEHKANAAYVLGDAEWRSGQHAAARLHLAQAVADFSALEQLDPTRRPWSLGLVRAQTAQQRGKPSLEAMQALAQRLQRLDKPQAPSVRLHVLRAEISRLLAQAQLARGQLSEAKHQLGEVLALLNKDAAENAQDLRLHMARLELSLFQAEQLSPSSAQQQQRCATAQQSLLRAPLQNALTHHAPLQLLAARAQHCLTQTPSRPGPKQPPAMASL
ncbi:protein kinase [Roseateles sp. BYS180W]|uniref:Protein kinase n=1 Tax=Roseateles rivi TaxID=3299028 RepID=A0ABW7FQN3_9BURK